MAAVTSIIAAGTALAGTGMSIAQASGASREKRKLERQQEAELRKAEKLMSVNRMEGLQVPIDVYERARQELKTSAAQGLQALQEADERTLAAGIGKLGAQVGEGQQKITDVEAKSLFELDKAVAERQEEIDKGLFDLGLEQVSSLGMRQAELDQIKAQALGGAVTNLGALGVEAFKGSDLFGGGRQTQLAAAKTLQDQGQFGGMNVRQARRAMLQSGQYTPNQISRLASGVTAPQPLVMPSSNFTGSTFSSVGGYNAGQSLFDMQVPQAPAKL